MVLLKLVEKRLIFYLKMDHHMGPQHQKPLIEHNPTIREEEQPSFKTPT